MDTVETSGTRDATMRLEKEKETMGHEGREQSKMFRKRESEEEEIRSQGPVSKGKTMVRRRGQVGTPARKIYVKSKKGT